MRRTWNVDISFPEGLSGPTLADVRGRDLLTDANGASEIVDELHVSIEIDPTTATIVGLDSRQAYAALDVLVGICLRGGFGRQLAERLPHDATDHSLSFSALEGLGGAYLVSGYSHLRSGLIPQTREIAEAAADIQADVCIGWAREGSLIENIRIHGRTPIPIGPRAPDIAVDAISWHEMSGLAPGTVRRRRRIDVFVAQEPADRMHVQQHFRDSYAGVGNARPSCTSTSSTPCSTAVRNCSRSTSMRGALPWNACPGALAGRAATRRRRELRYPEAGAKRTREHDGVHTPQQHAPGSRRRALARKSFRGPSSERNIRASYRRCAADRWCVESGSDGHRVPV